MYSKSYEIASKFTKPLVVCIRFFDKSVESGLGTFVILNDEGWLISVAHNFGVAFSYTQHKKELEEYYAKIDEINSNVKIKDNKKKAMIRAIKTNPKWITNFAVLLAGKPIKILQHIIYGEHDIAFLRIDKNAIKNITDFPKIINPANLKPGTGLCKFGYPFVKVVATFDETKNIFVLPENLFPVPIFPIEGIYTRNIKAGRTKDGTADILYLETSSPGLKGQSGGPICDVDGNIYAIQSKNQTIDLGFKGKIEINKKIVEENQFINIGIGVHPKTIVDLLTKYKIKFDLA